MPKLTKKAIRSGWTDGQTDIRTDWPNYRKALLLKRQFILYFWGRDGISYVK